MNERTKQLVREQTREGANKRTHARAHKRMSDSNRGVAAPTAVLRQQLQCHMWHQQQCRGTDYDVAATMAVMCHLRSVPETRGRSVIRCLDINGSVRAQTAGHGTQGSVVAPTGWAPTGSVIVLWGCHDTHCSTEAPMGTTVAPTALLRHQRWCCHAHTYTRARTQICLPARTLLTCTRARTLAFLLSRNYTRTHIYSATFESEPFLKWAQHVFSEGSKENADEDCIEHLLQYILTNQGLTEWVSDSAKCSVYAHDNEAQFYRSIISRSCTHKCTCARRCTRTSAHARTQTRTQHALCPRCADRGQQPRDSTVHRGDGLDVCCKNETRPQWQLVATCCGD